MTLQSASGMKLEIKEGSSGTSSFINVKDSSHAMDNTSSKQALAESLGRQSTSHPVNCISCGNLQALIGSSLSQKEETGDAPGSRSAGVSDGEEPAAQEDNLTALLWKYGEENYREQEKWLKEERGPKEPLRERVLTKDNLIWLYDPENSDIRVDFQSNYEHHIILNTRHAKAKALADKYSANKFTLVHQSQLFEHSEFGFSMRADDWEEKFEGKWYRDPDLQQFVLNLKDTVNWDSENPLCGTSKKAYLFEATRARLSKIRAPTLQSKRQVMLKIAQIIAALHRKNIVHRDITMDNFYLTTAGHVKIANFYYAVEAEGEVADGLLATASFNLAPWSTYHTYGAPELYMTDKDGGRKGVVPCTAYTSASEVYSMGVLFYEILTGQIPEFRGKKDTGKLKKIQAALKKSNVDGADFTFFATLLDNMMSNSQEEQERSFSISRSSGIRYSKSSTGRPSAEQVSRFMEEYVRTQS